MGKTHFTPKYEFPDDGTIRALSVCGIYTYRHRNFINCTVVEERVNCQKCITIMNKKMIKPKHLKTEKMKVESLNVERITKDVSCKVITDSGMEWTMCGEIINGDMDGNKVAPVFYQSDEFAKLCDEERTEITEFAFWEFRALQ